MEAVVEWECTPRCRSHQHGDEMAAAIAGYATDHQAKAYLLSHCLNPFHVTDHSGRNLLHVATSCGRLEVVDWLLAGGADCRVKDKESGWTPLHRSLYFGQIACAIHLMRHGASLKRYDKEDLTPLGLLLKDSHFALGPGPRHALRPSLSSMRPDQSHVLRPSLSSMRPDQSHAPLTPTQAYSWGLNSNFNLGHGRQRSREQPELVDSLASSNDSIKQVVMCKFHTLFLTVQGRVMSCGHGQGGRLGLGTETTCLRPQLVKSLGARCKMMAAARDHSVFLMDGGNVMSCGENAYLQLGHSSIGQKCLLPKSMASKPFKNREVQGLAAGRFHTVVYTREAVFTLGLNAGQLGHNKGEDHISSPRLVTSLSHPNIIIKDVVCSNAATVCLTKEGDIYVLHEYLCRKVASNNLSIKQLAVIGGYLNAELAENVLSKQGGEDLQLLALHANGKVHCWGSNKTSWPQCVWNHRHPLTMTRMAFNPNNMVLVTSEGEAFLGRFSGSKRSQGDLPGKSTVERGSKEGQGVSLERLPVIHRASDVVSDPQGKNFVVLQWDPRTSLTDLPELSASEMEAHCSQLMEEADSTDLIHDVLIKIGNHRLSAHKYILASGSDYFSKLFADRDNLSDAPGDNRRGMEVIDDDGSSTVDLTDIVDYDVFRILMHYIYTGTCDVFKPGFNLQLSSHKQNGERDVESKGKDYDLISDETFNMGELTINERNRHQSAYSVYREHEEGKKKEREEGMKRGKRGKKKGKGERMDQDRRGQKTGPLSAVKVVMEEAKKFGMKTLATRLENVKYIDGTLVNFGEAPAPHSFERARHGHLSDVVLAATGGQLYPCHKCVLTARLDYFQSMLGSGWMEASAEAPLQMAIPARVLDLLLDYLYMDQAPSLKGSQDLELLCDTLIVADQLFVTRLKDICEVALADLITLRNVSELLQFSSVYQASQLKASCHQFVCHNLACLLDAGSLDLLEDDVLEELSVAYKEKLPYSRFIQPSMNAPDLSHISPYPPEQDTTLNDQDSTPALNPKSGHPSISDFETLARQARARRKGRRRTSSTGKHASGAATVSENGEDVVPMFPANASFSEEGRATSMSHSHSFSEIQPEGSAWTTQKEGEGSSTAADGMGVSSPTGLQERMDRDGGGMATLRGKEEGFELARRKKRREKVASDVKEMSGRYVSQGKDRSNVVPGSCAPLSVTAASSHTDIKKENDVVSPAVAKSWSWISTKSPVTGLRDIMQSQAGHPHHQASMPASQPAPTHAARSAPLPQATSSLTPPQATSPTQQPSQQHQSRGATPIAKKSQKQRKKEMQAALAGGGGQLIEQPAPVACPWGKVPSPSPAQVSSFRALQAQDEEMESIWGGLPPGPVPGPSSSSEKKPFSAARKISFGLAAPPSQRSSEMEKASSTGPVSPESAKEVCNPWQRSGAASPPAPSVRFTDIVKAESDFKDNLDKARNKTLAQIQFEERAIMELYAQYQGVGTPGEYITVERVQGVMATPLWKKKKASESR